MSKVPANTTYKQQNDVLVRATFKKAFVVAVNVSTNSLDVSFAENPQSVVRNIVVSNAVTIASVVAGARCRVDCYGENNPADMVVAYTY